MTILNKFSFILAPLFYKILYMSIIAAVVGLVVLVIQRCLYKVSPKIKSMMWILFLLALIVPIDITSKFSIYNKIPANIGQIEDISFRAEYDIVKYQEKISNQITTTNNNENNSKELASSKTADTIYIKSLIFDVIIPYLWLFVVMLILVIYIGGYIVFLRKITKQNNYSDERINSIFNKCKKQLKVEKDIKIVFQNEITTPAIFGVKNVKVLINKNLLSFTDEEIEYAFMHELIHYKRRDNITNVLLMILKAIYFFNPIVWYLLKQIRRDIEVLTDAGAIIYIDTDKYKEYCKTLVNLTNTSKEIGLAKVLCISDEKNNLKRRINMIKLSETFKKNRVIVGLVIIAIIIVVAVCFLTKREAVTINNTDNTITYDKTDLASSISNAILMSGSGHYSSGECVAEGHEILRTDITDNTVVAYLLAMYGEYGFENDAFIKVSGSGVIPTVIEFSKNENGEYELLSYEVPEDGTYYIESIKDMFPEELHSQVLAISKKSSQELKNQEQEYAKKYLKSINRDAFIGDYKDIEHKLPNMIVKASNILIDLDFPYWIGSFERIENGVRYVYQTEWVADNADAKESSGIVTHTKKDYKTGEVVLKRVCTVDNEGNITYKYENAGKTPTLIMAGTEVNVDLDGNGIDEIVYYGEDDFRINNVSYKNEVTTSIYLDNPNVRNFLIVDLNKNDKQKEVVLMTDGPSDDPTAHFFTYNNNTMLSLGFIPSSIDYYKSFDGNGNISGNLRLSILQTWWAPVTWSLQDNQIKLVEQEIYYPYNSQTALQLKCDLMLYKDLKDTEETVTVKPQEVRITATDNKRYCYLEAADGTKGWFSVSNIGVVESVGKYNMAVFDNLCLAD